VGSAIGEQLVKIHIQPITEIVRFFRDDQSFSRRDEYLGVVTAIHSYEGDEVYLGGAHIDGLTHEHFEMLYSAYAKRRVKRMRWMHKGKFICVDLETGKTTSKKQ